jgi:hypothetical protein
MSKPTYCPQCQAPLKVPAGLAADKAIICPACRLKFVPPVSDAPTAGEAAASHLGLILLVLGIVIFASAIGIWSLLNRSDPAITSAAGDNVSGSDGELSKLTAKLQSDASETKAKDQTAAANPAPAPSKPEVSQPIKKPVPKTYAETKRPEEGPSAAPVIAVETGIVQQQQVNEAIDRGVAYLKAAQYPTGTWSKNPDNAPQTYSVGYAALGGLTLLECQVPAGDPAVQKAAAFVRTTQITDRLHRNYQMACVILFLDRLGDPQDRALIQNYALHLVAGQSVRGGWTYDSPDLSNVELQQLLHFLEATRLPVPELQTTDKKEAKGTEAPAKPPAKKSAARPKVAVPPARSLSQQVLAIPIVYLHYFPKGTPPEPKQREFLVSLTPGDNSNTQFALLALWAARRHDVATERCLIAAAHRFVAIQNKDDGGWSYYGDVSQIAHSTPAMTSVGLAMGYAVMPKPPPTGKLPEVPAIANALTKLGKHIDADDMKNFYFLWSVERVAMLYNLKTIGSRDWYDVGAKMLLSNQQKEGNWSMGRYSGSTPPLDTCFALLFLKRSNLVQDLSDRLPFLMAIRDPGGPPER